jgi:hypothetical protein
MTLKLQLMAVSANTSRTTVIWHSSQSKVEKIQLDLLTELSRANSSTLFRRRHHHPHVVDAFYLK